DSKPYLLEYHPKAIIGSISGGGKLQQKLPAELMPVVAAGNVRFQFFGSAKPVSDAEATVILPDGTKEKTKTDKDGFTREFSKPGRYGVWVRYIEARSGTHEDKKYDEIRHYATLVVDVPAR